MTLGAPSGVDVEALKAENEQLKLQNAQLVQKVAEQEKLIARLS